jgi:hypothetical protein
MQDYDWVNLYGDDLINGGRPLGNAWGVDIDSGRISSVRRNCRQVKALIVLLFFEAGLLCICAMILYQRIRLRRSNEETKREETGMERTETERTGMEKTGMEKNIEQCEKYIHI